MQPTVNIPVILFALVLSTSVVHAAPLPIQNGHPNLIIKVQEENKVIEQEHNQLPSPAPAPEAAAPAEPAAPAAAGSNADNETKIIDQEHNQK